MDPLNLPAPFSEIPRQTLLFGSSPIHRLDRISDDLSSAFSGYKVDVYAKRDDCNSALAFGGNKMRKLEYLLAEALEQGADTLVSIGGIQSNHTRQVAAVAAKYGLKVKLVQENWVDYPSPIYSKIGNIQLSRLMGADPHLDYQSTFGIEHKPTTASLTAQVVSEGGKPYYIPAGASDHPLGGLGFARWSFEVYAQEKELGIFFDTVVVCAVSGSTLAGMVAGFKLLAKTFPEDGERLKRRKVIGIDASAKPSETRAQVMRIAKVTAEKVGLGEDEIREEDIILDERYHAGAYGIPDKQTIEAIRYGARMDAFITDPVYEGKSLAGMIDMIRKGEICPQDGEESTNVLYAHLGGQPALNVYWDMEERIIV
ncbi:tryptophan synthase beta subunit-like PLP-dependent enzyme [Lentinula boryana]|uniref:Tryptophan synthase beta subunit-like PLP-dependent enzyme n=1 Tax=Lentinula boryana TaxID=40481 RepID=A0ABQ8Q8E1_9AGAR|nr:tryptophan synthase beta subunit-like PLP-dependent enzyme [Lentinula boryana]